MSAGAFPTLIREASEECDRDISPYLAKSACLGIVEVRQVDAVSKTITEAVTPVFICRVPTFRYPSHITEASLSDLPGPLYPDAGLPLEHLKRSVRTGASGPIFPVFLNGDRMIYFMVRPERKYLTGYTITK